MKLQSNEKIILSDVQKEVLYGALLGDGSLIKHKHGVNAAFSYISKSRQHVEFVANYFKEYWTPAGIKNNSYFDYRTNKTYFNSKIKTYANLTFTEEQEIWYQNGVKHIPKNLKLTPLTCLIWYIGDGGICHSKKSEYIKLSTHCFSKEEQENILLPQLSQFHAKLFIADRNKDNKPQYCIYIPHHKEKEFLQYIGCCPFSDYSYKWDIKEYKNFYLPNQPEVIQKIIVMFENGYSAGTIAKEIGIDRSTVVKYLIQNELNPKDNLFKRKKVGGLNEE